MPLLKLIDFGCSNHVDDEDQPDFHIGTIDFTAPEAIPTRGGMKPKRTVKSDMWSIGVIIYVLLSGEQPFAGMDDNNRVKMNIL